MSKRGNWHFCHLDSLAQAFRRHLWRAGQDEAISWATVWNKPQDMSRTTLVAFSQEHWYICCGHTAFRDDSMDTSGGQHYTFPLVRFIYKLLSIKTWKTDFGICHCNFSAQLTNETVIQEQKWHLFSKQYRMLYQDWFQLLSDSPFIHKWSVLVCLVGSPPLPLDFLR